MKTSIQKFKKKSNICADLKKKERKKEEIFVLTWKREYNKSSVFFLFSFKLILKRLLFGSR